MMKRFLIIGMFMLGLAGCGAYKETIQVDDQGYLLITGQNFIGKTLIIDDVQEIDLYNDVQPYDLNGQSAIKIRIPAGSHNVKIVESGTIIVNRKFYISTGTSMEIQL